MPELTPLQRLFRERINRASSLSRIAASINAPYEMRWWYWQEFGTATRSEVSPTGPYPINPINAPILSFPNPDGKYVNKDGTSPNPFATLHVEHPGIHPHHMITDVVRGVEFGLVVADLAQTIIAVGFDTSQLRDYLLSKSMLEIKALIRASFAEKLSGTRIDGQLKGVSAADTFELQSFIVDTSE